MNNADVYLPEHFGRYPTTKDDASTYTFDRIETAEDVIRKDKVWYPESSGTFSSDGNKVIRFELPDLGCYDFQRSAMYMIITVEQTPALVDPYVRFPNGIWNIFNRVRHLDGAAPVEDRNDSNIIDSFWWLFQQDPTVAQSLGDSLLGFGTETERSARAIAGTTESKQYAIPYPLNFLTSGIMPLRKFLKQYVEFYLAPPNTYIETNGTNTVVRVTGVEWHFSQIEGDAYVRRLENDVDSGRFQVSFDGWQLFQNANLTVNNNLVISHRSRAFKGVFTKFRQGNELNDTSVNQKFWTHPKLGCIDYQYRILGDLWPELPVDCRGKGHRNYIDYLKWTNTWHANAHSKDAPNVDIVEFNDTAFVVMGDFTNDPRTIEKPWVINNISTSKMNTDLQLNVRFDVPPPAGYVADHLINYSIMVTCGTKTPFKVDY